MRRCGSRSHCEKIMIGTSPQNSPTSYRYHACAHMRGGAFKCITCFFVHTLLKVVRYHDLSVSDGFPKYVPRGGGDRAQSSFLLDFLKL